MSSNVEKEPGPQADSPAEEPEKKKREYKDFGHDEHEHTRKSISQSETTLVTYLKRQMLRLTCLRFATLNKSQQARFFMLSFQIELKAEDLYDKDKVDLETIVLDDVFKLLQCDDAGLALAESQRRLQIFGPNKLESEEQNAILQVFSFRRLRFDTWH